MEQRQAINRRIRELMDLMDEMVPGLNSLSIPKWVEIYKEREALERQADGLVIQSSAGPVDNPNGSTPAVAASLA